MLLKPECHRIFLYAYLRASKSPKPRIGISQDQGYIAKETCQQNGETTAAWVLATTGLLGFLNIGLLVDVELDDGND